MKPNQQKEISKCSDESGNISNDATRWLLSNKNDNKTDVWLNTNFTEERQRIREFWLQLSELDRRSLVKVEKEAVLRKMKEQQRHSCNCSSPCLNRIFRSAIEAELEVLYDAYYDELEQYAHRQQHGYVTVIHSKKEINRRSITTSDQSTKNMELTDTLTVKGAIITVADDLLKNDGRKFLDMMERLAEKKLLKEREVADQSDKEEEEEDQVQVKDEEEEEDFRTEDQRMEEGRKMFQVFAARMFEQRVLTAYREKVAQDRQRRLIEELEEEDKQRQERELRKQQEKEKKRDKKRQLKLQQEKERLELENKKKEEEMAAKADRERKAKMERQIREQERLKREEERLQREKDRLRKEQEKKKRRLKEEADKEQKRKEEAERLQKIKEEEEKEEEKKRLEPSVTKNQHHHVLTDSTTTVTPINQRRKSVADPIGSPARLRPNPIQYVTDDDSETQHSFFSNFLFSQPTPQEHHKDTSVKTRRVSTDGATLKWSNGWTPLTALSDNVHGKLFGDVLAGDRNTLILERARFAYVKLDELAQTKFFMTPNFHTLDQLHRMVRDLFHDMPIDPREVYEVINHHPTSEFKCFYNQSQQCYIVQHGIMPSRSTSLLPTMISPLQLHTFQNS
ncbi:unnamed protein product [Mucor hiemalis]